MGSRSYYVSIGCGLTVSMAMVTCLWKSSFLEMHFGASSKLVPLILLLTLLFAVLFISPHFDAVLLKLHHSHVVLQVLVHYIFTAVLCAFGFVLKNHKFDHTKSYCMEDDGKTTLNQYTLYSLVGFVVTTLIISWERKEEVELGFFSILLQLTMEISLEINISFTLVTALFSLVMIFARRRKVPIVNDTIRSCLVLVSTVVGVVFLYMCAFTEEQFRYSAESTKGVFFIILGILLVHNIPHAAKCIDILAKASRHRFLVKALVSSVTLLFVSVVILLNRYPGFRIRPSCVVDHHANLFDLLGAGAFSVYALIVSSQKRQPMELGIFSFSLELTMYICVATVSGKNLVLWFFCCFAFCVLLILIRSYLGSLVEVTDDENSVGKQAVQPELELNDIQVIPNDNKEDPPGPNMELNDIQVNSNDNEEAPPGPDNEEAPPGPNMVSNEHATSFSIDGEASEISEDGGREQFEPE